MPEDHGEKVNRIVHKDLPVFHHSLAVAVLFAAVLLAGCRSPEPESATIAIGDPVDGTVGGAAADAGRWNVTGSPYFPAFDFYRSSPTKTLVKLKRFKTFQQTSERSCGAAAALMVLQHFGVTGVTGVTESELDREMDIRYTENRRPDGGYGCTVAALAEAFRKRGFSVKSSLDGVTFETPEEFSAFLLASLRSDTAVLVENVTWGGHWMVLIGYDTLGSETVGDDVLIFADPYDTADHRQDGYTIQSLNRFFYEWFDAGVLAPGITRQPFVAVSKERP